jgi:hypothetical protein
MVNELTGWLISVAGAAAIIIFLAKAALAPILSRDVERHKATLQRETAIEIERAKAEQQRAR